MVIDMIVGYSGVREAAVTQRDNVVSLVLIVEYATSQSYARELGDNFVRLAKSLLGDSAPGKAIGTGKYDYMVGIYLPNEEQLALGAKARTADRISW